MPMESEAVYHLTMLRHAESQGNAFQVWQGQEDYPLTARGLEQAQALASRWRKEGVRFDRLISSPLTRAADTARAIATVLNLEIETREDWIERDNGVLAGTHRDERPPMPDFIHTYMPVGEKGESANALFLRAGRALHAVLDGPPGRVLIVSHGGILNMAVYAVLGIAPLAHFRGPRFAFGNTGFASLVYDPLRGQWRVIGINDTRHLAAIGEPPIWQP